MTEALPQELEAYCFGCPNVDEVEEVLRRFGFRLTFTMPAVKRRLTQTSLPAQYHFQGPDGMELLYLAGRDVGNEQRRLPPHQSRFWAVAGSSPQTYTSVLAALAKHWALQWQTPPGQPITSPGLKGVPTGV